MWKHMHTFRHTHTAYATNFLPFSYLSRHCLFLPPVLMKCTSSLLYFNLSDRTERHLMSHRGARIEIMGVKPPIIKDTVQDGGARKTLKTVEYFKSFVIALCLWTPIVSFCYFIALSLCVWSVCTNLSVSVSYARGLKRDSWCFYSFIVIVCCSKLTSSPLLLHRSSSWTVFTCRRWSAPVMSTPRNVLTSSSCWVR